MRINEDDLNLDGIDDFAETDLAMPIEDYAEIEVEVAEPTKITDIDGSVIIATPGDLITIRSESIKRFK